MRKEEEEKTKKKKVLKTKQWLTSAADAPGVGKGIHIAYYAKQVTKAGPHVYDLAVVVTAAVAICRVCVF